MNISSLKKRICDIAHLDDQPWQLALGFSIGVFISLSPFFGLHTIIAIALSIVFRLNKVATITGAWVNLPWIAPFVYLYSYFIGSSILSLFNDAGNVDMLTLTQMREELFSLHGLKLFFSPSNLEPFMKTLLLGTTTVGLVASFFSYFFIYYLIKWIRNNKNKTRDIS